MKFDARHTLTKNIIVFGAILVLSYVGRNAAAQNYRLTWLDLPNPSGQGQLLSQAWDINDQGLVVGTGHHDFGNGYQAFKSFQWMPSSNTLNWFDEGDFPRTAAVNACGKTLINITGFTQDPYAVVWNGPTTTVLDSLPSQNGYRDVKGADINSAGTAVGKQYLYRNSSPGYQAVIWEGQSAQLLNVDTGSPGQIYESWATSINESG